MMARRVPLYQAKAAPTQAPMPHLPASGRVRGIATLVVFCFRRECPRYVVAGREQNRCISQSTNGRVCGTAIQTKTR